MFTSVTIEILTSCILFCSWCNSDTMNSNKLEWNPRLDLSIYRHFTLSDAFCFSKISACIPGMDKRPRLNYYIRLESESSLASEEDTESVNSLQGRETGRHHHRGAKGWNRQFSMWLVCRMCTGFRRHRCWQLLRIWGTQFRRRGGYRSFLFFQRFRCKY